MSRGEKKMEFMSRVDRFWYSLDQPTNLMEIVTVLIFDEPIDFDKLLELIEERLLIYDRFKQRVVFPYTNFGPAYWQTDPNFDVMNHAFRIALPSPGDKATLQKLVSDLSVIPLDRNKPLWLVRCIENYNGKGSVLFWKFHHAVADGIGLVILGQTFFDAHPNKSFKGKHTASDRMTEMIEHLKEDQRLRISGLEFLEPVIKSSAMFINATRASVKYAGMLFEKGSNEILKALAHPRYAVKLVKAIVEVAFESLAILLRLTIMPNDAKTAFKGKIGIQKTVCWSEHIPVNDVKEIGKAFKATINDVLMSSIAGALHNYLIDVGDDPDIGEIRYSIPVNVRKDTTKFKPGNEFSLLFVSLPTNIENPYERLMEVRRRMQAIKSSPEAFVGFTVMQALGYLPLAITKRASTIFANKTTGVLTNVPGPQKPLYFTDKEVKEQYFWVPRTAEGCMGISIFSYAGNVSLGLSTDTRLVPDPDLIIKHFENELKGLLKIVKDKDKLDAFMKTADSA